MSGMFGSPTPPTPVIEKPTIIPLPDDREMRRAKRKSIAKQRRRGGRESTILTQPDKLGA